MDEQQRLLNLIANERRRLDPSCLKLLEDRRRELFARPDSFCPVSEGQYARLSEAQRQADHSRLRIAYILSREIEYLLAVRKIPQAVLDWMLSNRMEIAQSNYFGAIGTAVAFYFSNQSEVATAASKFVAGMLHRRSITVQPKHTANVMDMKPKDLFLREDSFPQIVECLVNISLHGGVETVSDLVAGSMLSVAHADEQITSTPREFPKPSRSRGDFAGVQQARPFDDVDCTVFAPSKPRVNSQILVQVFAHQPDQALLARDAATEFDEDAKRRGETSLGTKIMRGSTLTFELQMRNVVVDQPMQTLTWQGRPASVQLGVQIPPGAPLGANLGKVIVSQDTAPIGIITFKLDIVAEDLHADEDATAATSSIRFHSAFISYAAADRQEVLRRVQMLALVGIRYFQDVLKIDPGDRWKRRLFAHIDECDILLLFWSAAATKSKWVKKEWQYALKRNGQDSIIPVVIEGPPPPPPPPELAHLHFGDPFLYFLAVK